MYTIIKINEKEYIKCDDCIESFIEMNIPYELHECFLCNKNFNPNKIDEIECYGKCKKILDVCKDCHKKIMVNQQHIGLGTYEVCPDCLNDYLKHG